MHILIHNIRKYLVLASLKLLVKMEHNGMEANCLQVDYQFQAFFKSLRVYFNWKPVKSIITA